MLKLDLYIHSTGSISPAADADEAVTKLQCAEPDYTSFINPMQLRRMSKAVRMGIGASKACMDEAGITSPDALSIGTAMGCLQDTEFFLSKMVTQEEKMLTPTAFIQSTHNTVGGQIALLAGCKGHNMTYVHRGHSFEHAVINTKLYLQYHPGENVLVGAIDELTPGSHDLMQKAGFYTNTPIKPGEIANANIAGEGATFFMINEEREGSLVKLKSLRLVVTDNNDAALEALTSFLDDQSIRPEDIALFVSGESGDTSSAGFYGLLNAKLKRCPRERFKATCGEYATASAYGLSCGANMIITVQSAPILMVNNYCDHYSFWLLEAVL